MAWKKIGLLAFWLLVTGGCGTLPKSKGKLDKTPEMLILRGQDYIVCLPRGVEKVTLRFFIHLKWMPEKEILVWSGQEDAKPENPAKLFGKNLEVRMLSTGKAGYMTYHQLNLEMDGMVRSVTTVLVDCNFASAGTTWSSGDIVNGFAAPAAGS